MAAPKRKQEHVVMRNGHPFCLNCGETYKMQLPARVEIVTGVLNGFTKAHAHCRKTWIEPTVKEEMGEDERARFWLESGERGVSSETMYEVFTGRNIRRNDRRSHPLDPDDFRRCHLLLETVPMWRSRLDELKALGDPWPALVDNWPKLTAMLLEQMKTHKRNGMYEFMEELGC